jgi:hypothetical protein
MLASKMNTRFRTRIRSVASPVLSLRSGILPKVLAHALRSPSRPQTTAVITKKTIRAVEKKSIRDFLEEHRKFLNGRVLDFGAGECPYRDLVSGEYVPLEKGDAFPQDNFDAVLMTQVAQYLVDPSEVFRRLAHVTNYFIMTYPTHWEEVESDDWYRYTKSGMERLLQDAGFKILIHESRDFLQFDDFTWNIGYGVVAQSTKTGDLANHE